jgi:UDP-N-acetylmuramoyl-tripeptide--D-alanyl-D-alanine ligase
MTILSQRFRVLATPESYNTPMGIAITTKKLDSTHDVFIAEMGARSKGDVKSLAEMVKPSYAVITGVNTQHLETFGTYENILDTKYELVDSLPSNGKAFFSSDNDGAKILHDRFNGEKYLAGFNPNDNFVYASDVKIEKTGAEFMINVKGETPVKCKTILLGKHSISNICLAVSVAYQLGMTMDEIVLGINRIVSVGHRLEIVPNNKNVVIIDDSYNSNVNGVMAAMDVLDTFEGRKIVLTPGLVELGKEENISNFKMGKILASHADIVIITGKQNAEMLINGLLEGGMDRDKIIYAKSLKKGNEELNQILEEGDVILFENDLPDNYN